jgi:SAM-dependent methyltransferase
MNEKTWLDEIWKSKEYLESKKTSFSLLDSFLLSPPNNILDIGCGMAFESEMFQKKYNSNLYLLDGDFEDSTNATRDRKYGSADSMAFYSKISDLKKSFDNRNLNYTFIDANNIVIPKNLKFDLVYSNVSCGFHYPLDTYLNLLKTHTLENSVMIFDINSRYLNEQIEENFQIIEIKFFPGQKKLAKCRITFKK